ncbi:SDR family NAD(P)-dependent oxidoreductase [Hoeflea alexandrii]|uniref:SDR family NAD(P)-dependent oxidoreductase n=1 Tax=Hoeflea alexandrii TaxID=288436 RepID=UPI0022AF5506|nr:SDR family NAD(P)-dependent oxidoreductase [Hoeflea alexandrii]
MNDQVAVVTGGGGGLGLAVCRSLAQTGITVVCLDIGNAAERAAKALGEEGLAIEHQQCDVTNSAATIELSDNILAHHGQIDILINLAGVARNAKLVDVTDEDFDLTLSSNVRGTMNMMRTFAPHMKERGYGRIINTSSVAALGSIAGTSYTAAKGAIEAMTRTAAMELARYGITVNCVAPGIINTGMFQKQPERARNHMLDRTPMRRSGEPMEIAAGYRFLSSPDASYVTGQTLYVCGGVSVGDFR